MSVRARLLWVVAATGLITLLGVLAAAAVAFERFEHERSYDRANAFLERVVMQRSDLLELHEREPAALQDWLRSLLLAEPATQLYLLDAQGALLNSTVEVPLKPGMKVSIGPVQQAARAASGERMPYVMGEDPERMSVDAVIAARALRRASIAPRETSADGYLYLVAQQPAREAAAMARLQSTLAVPAVTALVALIGITTALAIWLVSSITRPLRLLSQEVAQAARQGFQGSADSAPGAPEAPAVPAVRNDEFGRLQQGFQQLLQTLRAQWARLQELDRFRRESVANLSHDLRSPLTASTAALETLQGRWAGDPARRDDLALTDLALRNTRNAARLVRALADLAQLDEPEFKLQRLRVDLREVLDDIVLRFAERARVAGVALALEDDENDAPVPAEVDVELFERAVANLVDNALKFTPAGGRVSLRASAAQSQLDVVVADTGRGVAPADLPYLFERLYQARDSAAPAGTPGSTGSEQGMGLGLAIVKRIAELHGGCVEVESRLGVGTTVWLTLPVRVTPALSPAVFPAASPARE